MEIKGEDFIKKVQLKQEENEIEQRLNEIKNAQSAYETQQNHQDQAQTRLNPDLDREIRMQEEQEYSDIMLGVGNTTSSSKNNANKKKYLVLGLTLVILFLLTIIVIRLLTNDSSEDESFSKNKEINQNTQTILEDENIEEQYQKIINEKLKKIQDDKTEVASEDTSSLDLRKIEEKETIIKEPVAKKVEPNVFEVKKQEPKAQVKPVVKKAEPKPVVKKVEPKPVVRKEPVKKSSSTITKKPSGTFVQVGAFSKMPNDKYLSSITKKGFKYKIYKVSINNKIFHKVLIGPYNSRGQAKLAIDNIKKQLNISGAFILTF